MKKLFLGITLAATLLVPALALAANDPSTGGVNNPVSTVSSGQYTVQNPLASSSLCGLIKNILQAAIAIGIPIAVLFIVYAGFKFVMAQGSPDKLTEARSNFMWTLVGIGIFLAAWLLAQVIATTVNQLAAGTGANGNSSLISCQ